MPQQKFKLQISLKMVKCNKMWFLEVCLMLKVASFEVIMVNTTLLTSYKHK